MDIYTYLPKLSEASAHYRSISKCKVVAWNHDHRRLYITLLCYGAQRVVKVPLDVLTFDLDKDCSTINRYVRRKMK